MSIGSSGRIVIEVEPDVKRQLYAALAREGMSLKKWFLRNAEAYLEEGGQLSLLLPKRIGADKADKRIGADKAEQPTENNAQPDGQEEKWKSL